MTPLNTNRTNGLTTNRTNGIVSSDETVNEI